LWFTGLSGAGKTTIAEALKKQLEKCGKKVCILDGDVVRSTPNTNLGFGREDIRENNRRIAKLAKEKKKSNDIVIVSIISPYREDRKMARTTIGDGFYEVFIDCPFSVCEERDVKGLYKKSRDGKINNLIGGSKSNPYENPRAPDIVIHTDATTIEEGVATLLSFIQE